MTVSIYAAIVNGKEVEWANPHKSRDVANANAAWFLFDVLELPGDEFPVVYEIDTVKAALGEVKNVPDTPEAKGYIGRLVEDVHNLILDGKARGATHIGVA